MQDLAPGSARVQGVPLGPSPVSSPEPGAPNTALRVAPGLERGALAPYLLAEEAAGRSAESNLRNRSRTHVPALLPGVPPPAAAPGSRRASRPAAGQEGSPPCFLAPAGKIP